MALLLDESRRDIAKLDPSYCDLPGCFGTFSFDAHEHLGIRDKIDQVKYCPECLHYGFHSSFHEQYLIQMCPLHLIKLEKIQTGSKGNSHHDRYIQAVIKLLGESNHQWLSFDAKPHIMQELERSHFKAFLKWIFHVQKLAGQWKKSNILALQGHEYNESTIEELFERLSWITPIPKVVKKIYGVEVAKTMPTIIRYPLALIQRFQALLSYFTSEELLLLYKSLARETGLACRFCMYVTQAIADLEEQAQHSLSCWAWSDEMWFQCDPDNWPYWGFINPYQYVARELQQAWLSLPLNSADLFRICSLSIDLGILVPVENPKPNPSVLLPKGHFFERCGIQSIAIFSEDYKGLPFGYELNIDSELSELLQDLFLEEAMADVANKLTWAKLVANGNSPEKIPNSPSSGNLFLTPNEGVLCVWRYT